MRLIRVTHIFYPESLNNFLYELSLKQSSIGYKINVITWSRQGTFKKEVFNENFIVYRLKGINFKLNGIVTEYPFLPSMNRYILRLNPDIIDAHSHLFLTTYMAIKLSKKQKIPSIVTVHGFAVERGPVVNSAQKIYLFSLARQIFVDATRIICLTRYDAHKIMKYYGIKKEKIRIIPNPVDINLFKPANKRPEAPVFIWVGRFVPEKGLQYLIGAMREVVKIYRDTKLILVGDGPLLPYIKNLVKNYNLESNVVFTGFIEHNRIPEILSKAYAFIFPSLSEGMPVAVLEAMACGLPVIASDLPGIREIIRNGYNGILVPSKSTFALKEAMIRLISNEQLAKKMGERARKHIEKRHSWDCVLKALDGTYKEILRR